MLPVRTFAAVACALAAAPTIGVESETLLDILRARPVPITVYHPSNESPCFRTTNCPVALVSPGYEGSADAYSFLATSLNRLGFLVVGVQHDLPTDVPMQLTGEVYANRSPYWRRGSESLEFLLRELPKKYPSFSWAKVVLVGHSNGGDISAWFARAQPHQVAALITLDHRRYPLPRTLTPRTLTIRSSDQRADPGVLPAAAELVASGTCVVPIAGSLHNDMHDGGPLALRSTIESVVVAFLRDAECRRR
jgi:predicted dienelactone hydrolase